MIIKCLTFATLESAIYSKSSCIDCSNLRNEFSTVCFVLLWSKMNKTSEKNESTLIVMTAFLISSPINVSIHMLLVLHASCVDTGKISLDFSGLR